MQVAIVGMVAFERESADPLMFTDVLFVPGLRKYLVPSSCLEDIGVAVLFGKEHVYLFPAGGSWADTRVLGVRQGRMDRRICETEGAYTDTSSNSSEFLWAKAYMIAVYLQDRCPHRTVKDMTPETFVGQKPHVDLLKIFGCDDRSHISEDVRDVGSYSRDRCLCRKQ